MSRFFFSSTITPPFGFRPRFLGILIGTLFSGCEKPTGYTLDNKKDPENKDYIPTEPDSFTVFKNSGSFSKKESWPLSVTISE